MIQALRIFLVVGGALLLCFVLLMIAAFFRDEWRKQALKRLLLGALEARSAAELATETETLPAIFRVDYARAVRAVLDAHDLPCELVAYRAPAGAAQVVDGDPPLGGILSGASPGRPGTPVKLRLAVSAEEEEPVTVDGFRVVRAGPHPFVLKLRSFPYRPESLDLEVAFRNEPAARSFVLGLVAEVKTRAEEGSVYRGALIRPTFCLGSTDPEGIAFEPELDIEHVVLDPGIQEQLESGYLRFRRHQARLEAAGVPTQRGLLLCGPPGTGKTSTCRLLRDQLPERTFLNVPLRGLASVEGVFRLAKRLAPSVVLLDDVDLYARSRETNSLVEVLGELMNQMDGLQPREAVDVILTSNTWKSIESALALRPGRIDQVIRFEQPSIGQRTRLLSRYLEGLESRVAPGVIAGWCEGFSPAQLRELVKRAVAAAAEEGEGDIVLENRHLSGILAALRDNPLEDAPKAARALRRRRGPLLRLRPEQPPPHEAPEAPGESPA